MEKRHKSKLLETIFTSYFFSCEYAYLEAIEKAKF